MMADSGRRSTRACITVVTALISAVSSVLQAPAGEPSARVASSVAAPWAWGVDGPVHATAVAGDMLVVGGDFSHVVGRGVAIPRHNLAAFSLRTGRPLAGWRADTDGKVLALEASAKSVWVGGAFTAIGSSLRAHTAKISLADGSVDPSFVLDTNGTVRALARSGRRLYAGGDFLVAQGMARHRVVASDARTGAVDDTFTAAAGGTVRALGLHRRRLYIGGRFSTLDGASRPGIGSVDAVTGGLVGPVLRFPGVPAGIPGVVNAIDVTDDGRRVVAGIGGSPSDGVGNQAVAWRTASGRPAWRVRLGGDGQAVRISQGTAYLGFHGSYRRDDSVHLLAVNSRTGRVSRRFRPAFTGSWGVLALAVSRRWLVAGGQFTTVDLKQREGIVIFPFRKRG